MSDGASERAIYDRVADAFGEALRTLAHDAANCAAVFDMEVSELGGADATGAGDSLRAATDRLRSHVQDLRALAAAKRADGSAIDEVLSLALRLMSRSARRDLGRVGGERSACRVQAPQLTLLLGLLVTLRAIIKASDGAGLTSASALPTEGAGVITLDVTLTGAALDELRAIATGALGGLGAMTVEPHATGARMTLRLPT